MRERFRRRLLSFGKRLRQRHGFEHGLALVHRFLEFRLRFGVVHPAPAGLHVGAPVLEQGGAERGLNCHCRFVAQEQKFFAPEFSKRNRAAIGIQEFHLEYAGRMHFDDRADLPGHQAISGLVIQQRNHIEQFDRSVLHGDSIARNR